MSCQLTLQPHLPRAPFAPRGAWLAAAVGALLLVLAAAAAPSGPESGALVAAPAKVWAP